MWANVWVLLHEVQGSARASSASRRPRNGCFVGSGTTAVELLLALMVGVRELGKIPSTDGVILLVFQKPRLRLAALVGAISGVRRIVDWLSGLATGYLGGIRSTDLG